MAAVSHGANTATFDLDICYDRELDNLERLAKALAPLHPRLRDVQGPVPFVLDSRTISNGLNFTLVTDAGDFDLFGELPGLGMYKDLAQNATSIDLYGHPVLILSLSDLIRSKEMTGRRKDLGILDELREIRRRQSH